MTREPARAGFPWDALAELKATAEAHREGIVNLSVGTPADPVPPVLQEALASAAAEPGYPMTHGTPELRHAAAGALSRRYGVDVATEAILPTIGSKEAVAWLPTLLGLGEGSVVAIPELAYPTYEVGARMAGAEVVRLAPGEPPPVGTGLVWLNSPSNPTGRVLDAEELASAVRAAREVGAVVASDECYLSLGWEVDPVSALHPSVLGGALDGVLAVHSLSKSSNLAGYRAGFITGDAELVGRLLELRRDAGMIVPRPVQQALLVALHDDEHVKQQRELYARRREVLRPALERAGFVVEHSEAGLYLWATRGENAWTSAEWLAERGILAASGTFYGPAGDRHVRVALTATDERIDSAAARL